ncbi:hypothetical protein Vadar_027773 [Vaccinium darrowii]|uniref:Uncharacterized protein n=1 Tax=Vaccinium darrowii TaxID=229202 RepID=A0ACB7Z6Q3_9ERIC|nr:hypothetical protein Vadar_027773 [Vaccinium darrowii]
MGNRYNNRMHHQSVHQTTTFLPMLCSSTTPIKDVHRRRPNSSSFSSSSSGSHPSSPKVTCMGQVNRSNRVTGYPPPTKTTTASPIKYHKLIRLFSGKNITTATTTTGRSGVKTVGRSRSERKVGCRDRENIYATVNVAELDPPLPVVKRLQQPAAAAADGNLWKRRSGGSELKTLQLQQIYLPNKLCVQPITTV